METKNRSLLYNADDVAAAITRLTGVIAREFSGAALSELAFLGIQSKGAHLAQRLADEIAKTHAVRPLCGSLDISMYRDDIGLRKTLPVIKETSIPFDVNERSIVLVDDVLSTGRTIRAALDAITDYGRPHLIRLAVMVDRGGQEFPIKADYIGFSTSVEPDKRVIVTLKGCDDDSDAVYVGSIVSQT